MKSFILKIIFKICEFGFEYIIKPIFQKKLDNVLLEIVKNHLLIELPKAYTLLKDFIQNNPNASVNDISLELYNILLDAGIDITKMASPEVIDSIIKRL